MSESPFFTVGIPTYNRAHWLGAAIERVLGQTFGDFELIVSDNDSSDETEKVVRSFRDPRLRYLKQPHNIGSLPNFNTLLAEARGEFMVFNQDDDRLIPEMLERCHAAVVDRPSVVFYGAPKWQGNEQLGFESRLMPVQVDALAEGRPQVMPGAEIAVSCLHSMPFLPPSVAFRTSVMRKTEGFDAQLVMGDIVTEVRVFVEGDCVWDPRVGAVARWHYATGAANVPRPERWKAYAEMHEKIIAVLESKGINWRPILSQQLESMGRKQLVQLFRTWTRSRVRPELQRMAWSSLRGDGRHSRFKLWRRAGMGRVLKYAASSGFGLRG